LDCPLIYIPEHLHTKEKPIIETFKIGEKLHYRCKKDEFKKPYDKISLYDISHNRNFATPDDYPETDVLYNILVDDPIERYDGLEIVTLEVKDLQEEKTYIKTLTSQNDPDLKAVIILKHSPEPCMYTHSVFEISINGIVINRANYSLHLNKKNRTHKNLRSDIRQELTSIIQTGELDSSKDIEFIDEL
jgi:hypothetical protein